MFEKLKQEKCTKKSQKNKNKNRVKLEVLRKIKVFRSPKNYDKHKPLAAPAHRSKLRQRRFECTDTGCNFHLNE